METPSDLTWEDVFAVCKLMGDCNCMFLDDGTVAVFKSWSIATVFTNPHDALEFISAEEHPLEKKHGRILRTKP